MDPVGEGNSGKGEEPDRHLRLLEHAKPRSAGPAADRQAGRLPGIDAAGHRDDLTPFREVMAAPKRIAGTTTAPTHEHDPLALGRLDLARVETRKRHQDRAVHVLAGELIGFAHIEEKAGASSEPRLYVAWLDLRCGEGCALAGAGWRHGVDR